VLFSWHDVVEQREFVQAFSKLRLCGVGRGTSIVSSAFSPSSEISNVTKRTPNSCLNCLLYSGDPPIVYVDCISPIRQAMEASVRLMEAFTRGSIECLTPAMQEKINKDQSPKS